jgi:zinc/manganese transport system substrate-binding protein
MPATSLGSRSAGVRPKAASLTGLAAVVLVAVAGCSTAGSSTSAPSGASGPASKVIQVVAAENFWGSIAAQLGGRQVKVTNIIDNPDADPHDYEPTAADGRAIASADVVLINGIGYDVWATKLADANPNPARSGLTVGQLIGVANGGNPHRWYNPDDVHKVVDQIVGDYTKIDPADSAYFQTQKTAFETTATADYTALTVHPACRVSSSARMRVLELEDLSAMSRRAPAEGPPQPGS